MKWYYNWQVLAVALLFQSRLVWLMHQRNARGQETFSLISNSHLISKYYLPENLSRFSKNTSLSLQQVFTLASVTSCANFREFLKDTTTADNHENVAWKREFTFFFSFYRHYSNSLTSSRQANSSGAELLSTYPSSWRERILSLVVYVLHKTWN